MREVSRQSISLKSHSNTCIDEELFVLYGKRGVTVRSVRYNLINGLDARVTANRYDLISALRSLNGRSGFDLHDLRYKTHEKRRP